MTKRAGLFCFPPPRPNHEKRIHWVQDRLISDKVRKHVVTRLRGQGSEDYRYNGEEGLVIQNRLHTSSK
jgi:hypothetical protein